MGFLYRVFSKFFQKEINAQISLAKQKAQSDFFEARNTSNNQAVLSELQSYIGKPVISISNEWDDPIIGIGKEIVFISKANTPKLVIEDYISGKEYMPLGIIMGFTEQRFKALSKLDPFEICSLLYRNNHVFSAFKKNKSGTFSGYDSLHEKLMKTDFYQIVENNKED